MGAAIGIAVILIDEMLGKLGTKMRFPPLAVGLGVYLPSSVTLMIAIGALIGWLFNKRADSKANPDDTKQLGILMSSGLIVGESIIGVILAAIVVGVGSNAPLALVGESFHHASIWLGGVAFVLVVIGLYRWVGRLAR